MSAPVLEVEDLRVDLRTPRGTAHVVNGLSYSVGRGETVAVVGESGSGKSVSVLALLGLIPARVATVTGSALLNGEDLLTMPPDRLRAVRGPGVGIRNVRAQRTHFEKRVGQRLRELAGDREGYG